ncbi:MAG TPA: DUF423 domain-containing protein [Flavipsychrobacter sp.]
MYKPALIWGALFAGLSVILGAFGAHALEDKLTVALQQTYETAARYQMYHGLALLASGLMYAHLPVKALKYASICFIVGTVLFSGSLYLLTMLKMDGQVGLGSFGLITPIGGLFFIVGWILFIAGCLKK